MRWTILKMILNVLERIVRLLEKEFSSEWSATEPEELF
jgi:hypothetical protein